MTVFWIVCGSMLDDMVGPTTRWGKVICYVIGAPVLMIYMPIVLIAFGFQEAHNAIRRWRRKRQAAK